MTNDSVIFGGGRLEEKSVKYFTIYINIYIYIYSDFYQNFFAEVWVRIMTLSFVIIVIFCCKRLSAYGFYGLYGFVEK